MKNKNKKEIFRLIAISIVSACFLTTKTFAADITPHNVITEVNQERVSAGLLPLTENSDLDHAATLKAKDMINRHYFEHFAFGLTPWDFMLWSGYDYLYAGENLAMDFQTTEGMMNAWINSPTHRDNILNSDYTEMGVGVVKGDYTENGKTHQTIMVSNMFGTKRPAILKYFDFITQDVLGKFF
jgi:uncharacterized protein YkwD